MQLDFSLYCRQKCDLRGEAVSRHLGFFECFSRMVLEKWDNEDFEHFDSLHFKTENELLKLAESIQKKIKDKDWDRNYGNKLGLDVSSTSPSLQYSIFQTIYNL